MDCEGLNICNSKRYLRIGNVLETILSVIFTAFLTLVLLALYIRRTLPVILEDVAVSAGEQITEGLKTTFADPNVKKAFSVLGKQSGEVRADDALRNKVADKIMEEVPSINYILEQLDLTPIEGLKLMQDPIIGPYIQGFIQKGLKGLKIIPGEPSSSW